MSHLEHLEVVKQLAATQAAKAAAPQAIDISLILKSLQQSDPTLEGVTYQYSTVNALPPTWMLQCTPGRTTCELLDAIKNRLGQLVAAQPTKPHFIDITHLGNNSANDSFQRLLAATLVKLAQKAKAPVTVRYIEGNPASTTPNPFYFAQTVLAATQGVSGIGQLTMYFANLDVPWADGVAKRTPGSWNHAKIFAIDGVTSIVGGMNYWSDYMPGGNDLYDASINVDGAVAGASHGYADYLWSNGVKPAGSQDWKSLKFGDSTFGSAFPPPFSPATYPAPIYTKSLPVLAVGNLGLWGVEDQFSLALELDYSYEYERIYPKNTYPNVMAASNLPLWFPESKFDFAKLRARQASTVVRHLALAQVGAGGRIRLSQQKIADTDLLDNGINFVFWPGLLLDDIVAALKRGAAVDILLSNHAPQYSGGYSDDMGGKALLGVIANQLGSTPQNLTIRQTPNQYGNHAKVWIANGEMFYVGSDNAYPGFLQEYGFVVADSAATTQFLNTYWNPIWALGVPPT